MPSEREQRRMVTRRDEAMAAKAVGGGIGRTQAGCIQMGRIRANRA